MSTTALPRIAHPTPTASPMIQNMSLMSRRSGSLYAPSPSNSQPGLKYLALGMPRWFVSLIIFLPDAVLMDHPQDVGGGSVKNGTPYSLCRIPLRWMVRECFKAKTGILFKSDLLHEIGLDISTLHPEVKDRPKLPVDLTKYHLEMVDKGPSLIQYWLSQLKQKGPTPSEASCGDSVKVSMASREDKGSRDVVSNESSWDRIRRKVIPPKRAMPEKDQWVSEEVEDLRDALSPMYDQLKLKRHWWFLEILPVTFKHQHSRSEVWAKHMR